jgi:hypothetical protein
MPATPLNIEAGFVAPKVQVGFIISMLMSRHTNAGPALDPKENVQSMNRARGLENVAFCPNLVDADVEVVGREIVQDFASRNPLTVAVGIISKLQVPLTFVPAAIVSPNRYIADDAAAAIVNAAVAAPTFSVAPAVKAEKLDAPLGVTLMIASPPAGGV